MRSDVEEYHFGGPPVRPRRDGPVAILSILNKLAMLEVACLELVQVLKNDGSPAATSTAPYGHGKCSAKGRSDAVERNYDENQMSSEDN